MKAQSKLLISNHKKTCHELTGFFMHFQAGVINLYDLFYLYFNCTYAIHQ
jgi:uncharacterized membrane protein